MDEGDIERVLDRVLLVCTQLQRAVASARGLPETPQWRGSSHSLAQSQQEYVLAELIGLEREFGELAYRCDRDLQSLRRRQEEEGLAGGHW